MASANTASDLGLRLVERVTGSNPCCQLGKRAVGGPLLVSRQSDWERVISSVSNLPDSVAEFRQTSGSSGRSAVSWRLVSSGVNVHR